MKKDIINTINSYLAAYRLRNDYNKNVEKAILKNRDFAEELNSLNHYEKNIFWKSICEITGVSSIEEILNKYFTINK